MFRAKSQKSLSIFLIVIIGLFALGWMARTATPAQAATTSSLAYHDQWRKLWEDHITWTRVVILGILDGLPGTGAYVTRLLQNPQDMGDALRPYYGTQADVLAGLIKDHLVIAAELLTAAKNGDTTAFNTDKTLWYQNATEIAVQMHKMNPNFWPFAETQQMWFDHLDATLEEATDNLTGNYTGEVAAYDKVHNLALQMADFMSIGVIRQFPGRFSGQPR